MDERFQADSLAKQRFWIIQAMRIAGVVMVFAGIAVFYDKLALPRIAGWLLLILGIVETFVTPQILARLWSSDRQP